MAKYASKIIELAQSWIGKKETDGSHKSIIDIYNSHKPLARGYKVKYTDSWCATFISALAIKCGATDIIPTECSCEKMIELFNKLGVWVEDENRTPNVGDIIFYDWQDNGKGDNKAWSDHVGIVEKVESGKITVIEGNISEKVGRRTIAVNGKNIRGYATPKYDAEPVATTKPTTTVKGEVYKMQTLKRGSKGNDVTIFETIMKKMGYYKGAIDTDFGSGCVDACNAFQKKYPECGTNGKPDSVWGAKCWNKALSLLEG